VEVAEKLGKTPAQVALRWGLQSGQSVLPKSTTESRIKENFDVFDWSIPEELFAKFSEIKQASSYLVTLGVFNFCCQKLFLVFLFLVCSSFTILKLPCIIVPEVALKLDFLS